MKSTTNLHALRASICMDNGYTHVVLKRNDMWALTLPLADVKEIGTLPPNWLWDVEEISALKRETCIHIEAFRDIRVNADLPLEKYRASVLALHLPKEYDCTCIYNFAEGRLSEGEEISLILAVLDSSLCTRAKEYWLSGLNVLGWADELETYGWLMYNGVLYKDGVFLRTGKITPSKLHLIKYICSGYKYVYSVKRLNIVKKLEDILIYGAHEAPCMVLPKGEQAIPYSVLTPKNKWATP